MANNTISGAPTNASACYLTPAVVTAVNGSPVITGNTFSGPALNECFGGDGNNLLLYDSSATVTGHDDDLSRGAMWRGGTLGVLAHR